MKGGDAKDANIRMVRRGELEKMELENPVYWKFPEDK